MLIKNQWVETVEVVQIYSNYTSARRRGRFDTLRRILGGLLLLGGPFGDFLFFDFLIHSQSPRRKSAKSKSIKYKVGIMYILMGPFWWTFWFQL